MAVRSTVWKFPLPRVPMPIGAQILTVAVIRDQPFVWAIVDPSAPLVERQLFVRGTGHGLGTVGDYIGTFMLLAGSLVFHVFDGASTSSGA